jgi:hypothetical protein
MFKPLTFAKQQHSDHGMASSNLEVKLGVTLASHLYLA